MPQQLVAGQKAFIVNSKSQVLIIKRSEKDNPDGYWDLPGGKLELGQGLRDALTRQVWEETGLTITIVSVPLNITTFIRGTNKQLQFLRIIYLCRAESHVSTSHEVTEFLWIDPNNHVQYIFPDKGYSHAFINYLSHSQLPSEEFLGPGILSDSADNINSPSS